MSKINPYDFKDQQPSNQSKAKPNFGRQLLVLGISIMGIILLFGLFGWLIGGVEAAKGALKWGFIPTLVATPSMVIVLAANPLSRFSGQWGEHMFKKRYESEHVVPEEDEKR